MGPLPCDVGAITFASHTANTIGLIVAVPTKTFQRKNMKQDIQRRHATTRMSKIVTCGGLVYLCGQTSSGAPAQDVASQTREVLSRIDALLAEVGTDKSRILSATIYLKSITDFAKMNECWDSWVPQDCAPARTTVEASLAVESLLVEITITAAA